MKLVVGENLWEEDGVADIIFVCAGQAMDKQGRLLMTRGEGVEAMKRHPYAPVAFGEMIHRRKKKRAPWGLIHSMELHIADRREGTLIGVFQTTDHPLGNSSTTIINASVRLLNFWADKWPRIALEFPTVYHQEEKTDKAVLEVLNKLPDNVWVYKGE